MTPSFNKIFQAATGNHPYGYQCRLACGQDAVADDAKTLQTGTGCESRLIDIPTGLGKTAAVVMAWLWNRVVLQKSDWPRRLVYCLPMRTLVEQTAEEVSKWIEELLDAASSGSFDFSEEAIGQLEWLKTHSPVILMGGEDVVDWDLHPEHPAILIGTQDMLLSRALNRGYGMSRYRWPMHFALLNNDCLWVLDETQLMGVGVETSAQLDGFRHLKQWLRQAPCATWWMSATLDDARLTTVDHPVPPEGWSRLTLGQQDREAVRHRLESKKLLRRAGLTLSKKIKSEQHAKALAEFVLDLHVPDQLTLVIVNRVSRAQDLYLALQKAGRKEGVGLVHSRFRSPGARQASGSAHQGDRRSDRRRHPSSRGGN